MASPGCAPDFVTVCMYGRGVFFNYFVFNYCEYDFQVLLQFCFFFPMHKTAVLPYVKRVYMIMFSICIYCDGDSSLSLFTFVK